MNRQQALEWLATDPVRAPDNEATTVAVFSPEDDPGVARLFCAVYGDGLAAQRGGIDPWS